MPDFSSPPTLTAVSVEPHSFPFAYQTCCTRVSVESGFDSTSGCQGGGSVEGGAKKSAQQPMPPPKSVLSFKHSPRGMLPTFWSAFGGNTYVSLLMRRLVICGFGDVFSDAVLVSAQRPIRRAVPVGLPVSEPSPAIVLRKYSVPFLSVA